MKLIKKSTKTNTFWLSFTEMYTEKQPFFFFFENTISPSDAIADVQADV